MKNSSIMKIEKRKNAESSKNFELPPEEKVYDSSFLNERPRTR